MIGIVSLGLKATAVILCAFAFAMLARRARASVRHSVFAALFVALLLLPVMPPVLPATTVEVSHAVIPSAVEPEESGPVVPRPGPDSSPSSRLAMTAADIIPFVYFGGVISLLLSLAAGVWRLRRWTDRAEIWLEGTAMAVDVARANGIRRAVLVVVCDDTAVPLTLGFRRQTVVMPAAAKTWTAEAVRRAVRHELEHVRRDDWAMQLVARIACAVWWPHPMVWLALRRFCVEAERACDDAVVNGSEAPRYAEQLVTLARSLRRHPAVPALAMASPSRLSERVHAILDPKQARGPQSRRALLLTVGFMAAVLVTFGSLQVVAAVTDRGSFDDDDRDAYREAIVRAAEKGNVKALAAFARNGVDLNEAIIGDGTPILIAARAGRNEAVLWLLEQGVDPNEPSPGDGNALIGAASSGQTDVMQILLGRGARIEDVVPGDENALITAAAAGSDQAVKLLISRGANVNARVWADGREWRTPLIMARRYGHRDIVRILINAGARE